MAQASGQSRATGWQSETTPARGLFSFEGGQQLMELTDPRETLYFPLVGHEH